MTLEKAIEILEVWNRNTRGEAHPKRIEATQLGIEALKTCLRDRRGLAPHDIEWLPGETED